MKVPEIRQSTMDRFAAMILPRRHCPSVVYYHLANTHHDPPTYDYTPSMLGEDFDKAKLLGRDPIAAERAAVKKLDPVRIAFAGSGGGKLASEASFPSRKLDLSPHPSALLCRNSASSFVFSIPLSPKLLSASIRLDLASAAPLVSSFGFLFKANTFGGSV